MEAKVDVRKLQLLNDRITQTIDALNQVRLSVHGLGHTGMQSPFGQQFGQQQPFGQQSFGFQGGYGQNPWQQFGGMGQGFQGGLQHTSPLGFQGIGGGINPLQYGGGMTGTNVSPLGFQGLGGMTPQIFGGLSHTGPDFIEQRLNEVRASDPYRISQTFPYINVPVTGTGIF